MLVRSSFDGLFGFHRGAGLCGVRTEVDRPGRPIVQRAMLALIERCFRTSALSTKSHQPDAKLGSPLKRIQVYVRAEATVLWRILGILAVEQQPECSAKEPAAVAGKRRGNRIGISSQCSLDETTFVSCRI